MLRVIAVAAACGLLGAAAEPPVVPVPAPAPASVPAAGPAVSVVPAPVAAASGQLRGTVAYARREPAVGAVVLVRPADSATPLRVATTGPNGAFAFDGLADGMYRAEIRQEGHVSVVKTGIAVRAPFRAVIEVLLVRGTTPREPVDAPDGSASLAGTIRVSRGAPLAEARVRLTRADGADEARSLLTDGSGSFSASGLKAGGWHLEVQGAGLLPLRADVELVGDIALEAQLTAQPADYRPPARDLIVPEEVLPPPAPK
jgi:hypothetical protein